MFILTQIIDFTSTYLWLNFLPSQIFLTKTCRKMYKFIFIFTTCILALLFSSSCSSQKQTIASSKSSKPKFIDGVVIESHQSDARKLENKGNVYTITEPEDSVEESIAEKSETSYAVKEVVTSKKITTDNHLYTFIEDWYGVPYRFGGTCRSGIDCSAFVRELYSDVYGENLLRTSREQFALSDYIKNKQELKEGDLVFFKIRSKSISHVGVYLHNGKFVHASRSKGVIISSLDDTYWNKYYAGGGRVSKI